jgi:predicted GTPase
LKDIQQAQEYADHLYDTKIISRDVPVFFGRSKIVPEIAGMPSPDAAAAAAKELISGKRVLVIDDGPTLTHGGLCVGAGYALAEQFHPQTVIDPRPFAQGSIRSTFEKYQHLDGRVLPAMGYSPDQCHDLQSTIRRAVAAASIDGGGVDVIVIGTPMDLSQVIDLPSDIPYVVARYDLEIVQQHKQAFDRLLDFVFVKDPAKNNTNGKTDDDDKKHCVVVQ